MADVITGIDGSLNAGGVALPDSRNWKVVRSNDVKKYSSSSTAGYQKTAKGITSWTLSFSLYGQDGELAPGTPAFAEGDKVLFRGLTTTGKYFEGYARIRSIAEGAQIEGADLEAIDIEADGDSTYTLA